MNLINDRAKDLMRNDKADLSDVLGYFGLSVSKSVLDRFAYNHSEMYWPFSASALIRNMVGLFRPFSLLELGPISHTHDIGLWFDGVHERALVVSIDRDVKILRPISWDLDILSQPLEKLSKFGSRAERYRLTKRDLHPQFEPVILNPKGENFWQEMNKSPAFVRCFKEKKQFSGWDDFMDRHDELWRTRSEAEAGLVLDENDVRAASFWLKLLEQASRGREIGWWGLFGAHMYILNRNIHNRLGSPECYHEKIVHFFDDIEPLLLSEWRQGWGFRALELMLAACYWDACETIADERDYPDIIAEYKEEGFELWRYQNFDTDWNQE